MYKYLDTISLCAYVSPLKEVVLRKLQILERSFEKDSDIAACKEDFIPGFFFAYFTLVRKYVNYRQVYTCLSEFKTE